MTLHPTPSVAAVLPGVAAMTPWQSRGMDGTGADTWLSVGLPQSLIITRHKQAGVQLWRAQDDGGRVLVSTGFRSVEAAKEYAERVPQ